MNPLPYWIPSSEIKKEFDNNANNKSSDEEEDKTNYTYFKKRYNELFVQCIPKNSHECIELCHTARRGQKSKRKSDLRLKSGWIKFIKIF